jgi:hypothetical protein
MRGGRFVYGPVRRGSPLKPFTGTRPLKRHELAQARRDTLPEVVSTRSAAAVARNRLMALLPERPVKFGRLAGEDGWGDLSKAAEVPSGLVSQALVPALTESRIRQPRDRTLLDRSSAQFDPPESAIPRLHHLVSASLGSLSVYRGCEESE